MTEESNGSGADKRVHRRSSIMLRVEYESSDDFIDDYTANISGGGVFIATTAKFDLNQVIDFVISFPGLLDPIDLKGEVKWCQSKRGDDEPAGIGVEFLLDESPGRDLLLGLIGRLEEKEAQARAEGEPTVFRVLLVEDNVVVRDMFRYGIQKLGLRDGFPCPQLEVVEAENGKEAWDLLNEKPVHLVIVDLYMPVMDGGQLIEYIRADEKLKDIPVLVVSSAGNEGRMRAIQTGADVYLDKPVKLKQMMETIETLITIGHSPKPR